MKLRERALALLARREHSRAELARKLAPYDEVDELPALLDVLERENLLSNARYAEALAHARAGKHGSVRLKADLREKGVPEDLAAEVIDTARSNDLESARGVWRKKFGKPPADLPERAKQMRFLASRGFPADVVHKVVGGGDAD